MSSRTLSSFWKEHASATLPGNRSRQKPTTSSAVSDSTSFGNCRLSVRSGTGKAGTSAPGPAPSSLRWDAKEHLLERVAAQPEPERLERDDLLGRDVPEVDRRAELLDEPRLGGLRRRFEDDVRR